jgi:hypothetical protein
VPVAAGNPTADNPGHSVAAPTNAFRAFVAWRGAGLARVCATAAIEAVAFGVGGHPWVAGRGLAPTAGLISQFDLVLPDIATTFLVTFWYAWLFNRTGGSVLLTLIAHSTEGSVNTQPLWGASSWAGRETWVWLISWTLLVVVLLIFDPKFWRTAPELAIDRVSGRSVDQQPTAGAALARK